MRSHFNVNDESFGPVAPIVAVDCLDEAIALANRSKFGLGANIYTADLAESMRAINELEYGMVWVSAPLLDNAAGPFGGRKMTGWGRELGGEGLEIFCHNKLVMFVPSAASKLSITTCCAVKSSICSIYDSSPKSNYYYLAGFNPAALIAMAVGFGVYVYLLNPVSYASNPPYQFLTASLPTMVVGGLVYWLVTKVLCQTKKWGGY
jgi:Aldehyde dehydrogenase family